MKPDRAPKPILFAGFRPGYAFAMCGGDVALRDLMRHLRLQGLEAELYGAGDVLGTWAKGREPLRRCLRAFGCRGELSRDRLVYRSARRGFGEGTLFASAEAELAAIERGLKEGRWAAVVAHFLGSDEIARLCLKHGARVFLYAQDWETEVTRRNVRFFASRGLPIWTVSRYLKRAIEEAQGCRATLLYPKIDYSHYRAGGSARRRYITLLNASLFKGLRTFLLVAAEMPDLDFLLVDGWGSWLPLPPGHLEAIRQLPNVRFLPPQADLRRVFEKTALLMVPTVGQETFGRVAPEAQCNGIPVVASRVGGLPEAVGKGGVLISDFEDPARWVRALRALRGDPARSRRLAGLALKNAERFSAARPDPRLRRLLLAG